ncbi:hypothetical protein GQ457_02G005210 [Hibiscus cannabinus]
MEIININQTITGSHFPKFVTKVLLPFSLLSLILSYPLLSNFRTLAYVLQLFSFSVDKNYMFLLCNGLLVFIATSSGLISLFRVESGGPRQMEVESSEPKGSILKAKVTAQVVQTEDLPLAVQYEEEDEEERSVEEDEDEEEEEEEEEEERSVEEDEEEEEEEEERSVEEDEDEELNKKCEEFIRRMKEGIQFEARN